MSMPNLSDLGALAKTAKTYGLDLGERVLATFAVATGAVLTTATAGNVGHASFWQAVGAGGVAAAYSLVKGVLAKAFGDSNSASLIKGV
ncbi:hypothetical protein [Streptomyces sp. NPDC020983]|uniref:hypothetical protein n=1 Tax=Streptomyces sp. NPDC020983 TaxID=3365106 RepID=UPI003794A1C8